MKSLVGIGLVFAGAVGWAAWVEGRPPYEGTVPSPNRAKVGVRPGGVHPGVTLARFAPAPGDSLVGFSAGCFWGTEEAFRKMPGVVATAVGYTGGTSVSPSYEVAHATGHVETVLVEFDPKRTPFASLLKTFWSLPRTNDAELPGVPKSPYRAAIWTYDAEELREARASLSAQEGMRKAKLRLRIQPAEAFYLAEDYHQQYDEKAGTEACPLPR